MLYITAHAREPNLLCETIQDNKKSINKQSNDVQGIVTYNKDIDKSLKCQASCKYVDNKMTKCFAKNVHSPLDNIGYSGVRRGISKKAICKDLKLTWPHLKYLQYILKSHVLSLTSL